jgi:hypothetical protein
MADTPPMSDRSDSKLQAVLNHDRSDHDDLGASYRGACKAWFARLTDREREVAREATEAFAGGYETRAEQIAAALPPAPRFPLLHEDD